MNAMFQRILILGGLNVSIGIGVGAACFSAWSIYARASEGFVRSVGGALVLFPLACLFGALIFIVPGILHGAIVGCLSLHIARHSYLLVGVTSALLASALFPSWLFLVHSPLREGWVLIACISAISAATAGILSIYFVRRYSHIEEPRTAITPPPLPANDRNA